MSRWQVPQRTVCAAGLMLLTMNSGGQAATGAAEAITFTRDWPAQATPFYRITVQSDGSGTFSTAREAGSAAGTDTEIHISAATREKLFAVEPVLAGAKGCESGKKLAQTGIKMLTLRRAGSPLTCTFNYSDDKRVQEAVNLFGGIETTLDEAPRLVHLRRYDRLGLDAEVASFLDAVKAGRAIELNNIAPVLETLATDGELMDRVRNRAADLLEMARAGK